MKETRKDEKTIKELTPEDEPDPIFRAMMNELGTGINRCNERLQRLKDGLITPKDLKKEQKKDDDALNAIRKRMREYKKTKKT